MTTVTFEKQDGKTLLVPRELFPSKEVLDDALAGMQGGEQLDELLVTLGASVGQSWSRRSRAAVMRRLLSKFATSTKAYLSLGR